MKEKREEDFEKDYDEDGFDPTKEAFFSDMMGMEEILGMNLSVVIIMLSQWPPLAH